MNSEGVQQEEEMTTFSALYYHLIWSTKNREKMILEIDEQHLHKYIVATIKNLQGNVININGMSDHIHILLGTRPIINIPDLVKNIKISSTKMMRQRRPNLNKFEWQDSYGIFSVSKSLTNDVSDYIANQKNHHQNWSFENELLTFLKLHEIDYDDKYVFG